MCKAVSSSPLAQQAHLLSTLCKPSCWGPTRFEPAAWWARTRSCSRSPNLAPNSTGSKSPLPTSRADLLEDPRRNPPLTLYIAPYESMRGRWTEEVFEGPRGTRWRMVARPLAYDDLQPRDTTPVREGDPDLEALHRVRGQRAAQVSQSLSEPVALGIRHPQTPIARTLIADLPTDQQALTFPKKLEKGSYHCHPMILRQRQYGQTVKDQGEDVHGAHLRPAL